MAEQYRWEPVEDGPVAERFDMVVLDDGKRIKMYDHFGVERYISFTDDLRLCRRVPVESPDGPTRIALRVAISAIGEAIYSEDGLDGLKGERILKRLYDLVGIEPDDEGEQDG